MLLLDSSRLEESLKLNYETSFLGGICEDCRPVSDSEICPVGAGSRRDFRTNLKKSFWIMSGFILANQEVIKRGRGGGAVQPCWMKMLLKFKALSYNQERLCDFCGHVDSVVISSFEEQIKENFFNFCFFNC